MDTITKRQQRILLTFLDSTQFLTSQSLATLFNVSTKTIRNEVKILNNEIQDFAFIESIPARGFQLKIKNQERFESFKKTFNNDWNDFIPSTPLERAYYILGLMLKEKDFIKIDDISDILFIDRTSVSRSLKYIRECLNRFGLEIIQKNGKGLKIEGDEFRFRQCMAEYLYHKPETLVTEIGKNEQFIEDLKEIIFEDGISMPERVFQNFIIHIQVQINRIINHSYIAFNELEKNEIEKEYEYLVAKDVARIIKKHFSIDLSNNEIDYLTIHILGKKSNSTSAIESCINNQLKKEIDDTVMKMLNRIYQVFQIDFKDDMYLRKAIGIHIHPMENRLKFNTYLRNPLIYAIKEQYLLAYLMSLEAWKVIANYTDYINIEDEIGYIAIHFQYALERKKRNHLKKRVILVNDYNVASSELLSFLILRKYNDRLVIENSISVSALNGYDLSKYDFLITTVPISIDIQIPLIKINPIMTKKDLSLLKEHIENQQKVSLKDYLSQDDMHGLKAESAEQVFKQIVVNECLNKNMSQSLFSHILPLKGFELNNQIAIHYILNSCQKSHLSVYVLDKPIVWKNKFVKVIIILIIGINSEDMIESVQHLLSQSKVIENIIRENNELKIYQLITESLS